MASSKNFFAMVLFMALLVMTTSTGIQFGSKIDSNWYDAHATFYGGMDGGGTMRKCIIIMSHLVLICCL